MHDFFLVFIVRSSQLTCLWMSAYGKGNLTRFSHDSGVMIFHLKIGSSGKKSLVKCSRTASIMSNFTTWHCVQDEMDRRLNCSNVHHLTLLEKTKVHRQLFKWASVQVLKCSSSSLWTKRLKCSRTASVFLDHFVIFPWSNKVTINKQDLESIN